MIQIGKLSKERTWMEQLGKSTCWSHPDWVGERGGQEGIRTYLGDSLVTSAMGCG